MRSVLLAIIRFYAWVGQLGAARRERKRIKAKLEKLRQQDPFNYTMH